MLFEQHLAKVSLLALPAGKLMERLSKLLFA
jgi:hypothetical protein